MDIEQHEDPTGKTNAVSDEIRSYVERYEPRVLDERQRAEALPALKELVLACAPRSERDASVMLSGACRFYADVSTGDGDIESLFTEAAVDAWSNAQKAKGRETRTVSNYVGWLRRLARHVAGLPARIRVESKPQVLPPPLMPVAFDRLVAGCERAGGAAMRGLVVAVGAGLIGAAAVGRRIELHGDTWVVSGGPAVIPVAPRLQPVAGCAAGTVLDGDWDALRDVAADLRVWFGPDVARQTFRHMMTEAGLPVADLLVWFALTRAALDGIAPYLSEPAIADDPVVIELLRG